MILSKLQEFLCTLIIGAIFATVSVVSVASAREAKLFNTPKKAIQALYEAGRANDQKAIFEVLGDASKEWILSGDPVQDNEGLERFIKAFEEKKTIQRKDGETVLLVVGKDDFPFPIPIVQLDKGWSFDAELGKEEILNRRIGRNELHTIQTLRAILDAQNEYASVDRNSNGTLEYASKFRSIPGKKDGLYWPVEEGKEPSPLGSLVADSVREGYEKKSSGDVTLPYFGYHYRILKSQGANTSDGAFEYQVNGKMIGGFAVIAYPAKYGASGFKTFIVNHDGIVYEDDLGEGTLTEAEKINAFDLNEEWKKS